jgi:hypothetical protein
MLDLKRYNLETKWPKLAKLQAEVSDLERERDKAQAEVMASEAAIAEAQAKDREADAAAIRSGKSLPKAQHQAKAEAARDNAERNLAAYQKAVADAQADLNAFIAEHRDGIRAAMVEALNRNDAELAHHAREAARRYAFREDARYDLKQFAPPPAPPDENAPAQKLSTTFIGPVTTQLAAGPNRGDVEGMLGYLAGLAPSSSAEVQPPTGGADVKVSGSTGPEATIRAGAA